MSSETISEEMYDCDHCHKKFPESEMTFQAGIWGDSQYCEECYDAGSPCESCGSMIEYGEECHEECQCDACREGRWESLHGC